MMHLSQVNHAVSGRMSGIDSYIRGVTTDSRQDCTDQLFVALSGERFDAHDFVGQAQQRGAVAALVERHVPVPIAQVQVGDTLSALGGLATWWRAQFAIPVVGITGSVGKTSVKEMLACIFSQVSNGLVTQGNFNNEIGVPLTLCRLSDADNFAIIEMGMNHAGEISRLTQMVKPTVALINNAAAAHLEGLGSIEKVALAKGEIFEGLSEDGISVINSDDEYATLWQELSGRHQVVTFGLESSADVSAKYRLRNSGISMQVNAFDQKYEIELPLVGKHNVMNALAAIAVSSAANIPVEKIISGLAEYRPVNGRLNLSKVGEITLIDDTYNANPASMQAAIEVLARFEESTLILGDMAELGSSSEIEHLRLGELAAKNGVDQLFAVGVYAEQVIRKFDGDARAFRDQSELLAFLQNANQTKNTVLVKGSRSARMENIVEHLIALNTISTEQECDNREGVS